MTPPRRVLGRGLDALLGGDVAAARAPSGAGGRELRTCPVDQIRPMDGQPRQRFADAALEELVASVREQGVLQPLLVRRDAAHGGFVLIAGERRWRAAQRAGLREVPVLIQEATERQAFEIALVENLQREDLDAIEEAEAYRRLVEQHGYTQETVAARIGKDRSSVANALRLLKLPARVRAMVAEGALTAGHARALLGLESPAAIERAARAAIERSLSVRGVEALVKRLRAGERAGAPPPATATTTAVRDLEDRLRVRLATRVAVRARRGGRGRIEIHYHSLDELDRLLGVILG